MRLIQFYREFSRLGEYLNSLALLLARFVVAFGFFDPAMMKWGDIDSVAAWFGSMGIPLPLLSAYLAASTEAAGVVLLTFGLLTRFIALPLVVVMLVAIFSVHIGNGFSAENNGFEIPLYYLIFLLIFIANGAGRFSLDHLFFEKK